MSAGKYIKAAFQEAFKGKDLEAKARQKTRIMAWRREPVVVRIEKPTNPVRAKELGYKAKQGIIIARIKIRRSSGKQKRVNAGRRHSRMGVRKLKRAKSLQVLAEERIARKYPNLEVMNSYWVGEDGTQKWFEVIMMDPTHPNIRNDKNLNWISTETRRVFRGKTSAGKKSRPKSNKKGSSIRSR